MMNFYKNLGGNSGISAYEIGADSITIRFKDGAKYHYNYSSTGRSDIEHMKSLASRGRGLNSFVSRVVRKRFAYKVA